MFIVLRILIILGLVRLLSETEQPFLCAGIYTAIHVFFGFISGNPIEAILLYAVIGGALAALYFWVLDKLLGHGFLFIAVAVVGATIGVV